MEENKLNGEEDERIKYIAGIFGVLSEINRFKIVLELNDNSRNVTELKNLTNMSTYNTSHHLKILRDAKIVDYRKVGKEHYYEINKDFKNSRIGKLILEDFVEV